MADWKVDIDCSQLRVFPAIDSRLGFQRGKKLAKISDAFCRAQEKGATGFQAVVKERK